MKKIKSVLTATALTGALTFPIPLAQPALADANGTAAYGIESADTSSRLTDLEVEPWIAESKWYPKYKNDPRVEFKQATSPAMNDRAVPLAVIPAKDPNRPTIYLLNGAGSGEQNTDWLTNSSVVDFYSEKNVNVVIPMSGAFSYYIDWLEEPVSGKYLQGPQKWETFLTQELPGAVEAEYNANGKRAIAGMSMAATSSLLLAEHNPEFYDAVGSFAGCAATSSPLEYHAAGIVMGVDSGNIPEQENVRRMWGPQGSPSNVHQDALVNAEKLRGISTYVSAAPGLLGETDLPSYLQANGMEEITSYVQAYAVNALQGIPIEGAVNKCTHDFKAKMDSLGIPATYNFRSVGVHNWAGWEEDLGKSWEVFGPALNS